MKKNIIVFIALIALTFISCEESFSPIGDYREEYVLNCVLRNDTNYQIITLSKNYFADGKDPYLNTEDPVIKNAYIRLWDSPDNVLLCRDTTIVSPFDNRYNENLYYYYLEDFKPEFNKELEIEAVLPNGVKLKSKTKTPESIGFSRYSNNLVDLENETPISISWNAKEKDIYYLPDYTIKYYVEEGGKKVEHSIEIPLEFINKDDKKIPVYPKATPVPAVTYDVDIIKTILESLSEGDPSKDKYSIRIKNNLKLLVMDQNLSSYFLATEDALDAFTIRLDEADFSNIEGGFGIFGSYFILDYTIFFSTEFIESFGYRPVFE